MDLLIRHYRNQKKLTITELSEKSGVNRNTISKLETGKNKTPSTRTLCRLAEALGVRMLDLYGRTEVVHD